MNRPVDEEVRGADLCADTDHDRAGAARTLVHTHSRRPAHRGHLVRDNAKKHSNPTRADVMGCWRDPCHRHQGAWSRQPPLRHRRRARGRRADRRSNNVGGRSVINRAAPALPSPTTARRCRRRHRLLFLPASGPSPGRSSSAHASGGVASSSESGTPPTNQLETQKVIRYQRTLGDSERGRRRPSNTSRRSPWQGSGTASHLTTGIASTSCVHAERQMRDMSFLFAVARSTASTMPLPSSSLMAVHSAHACSGMPRISISARKGASLSRAPARRDQGARLSTHRGEDT
jgi:hypothetical protein